MIVVCVKFCLVYSRAQVVKMYGWEPSLEKQVQKIRSEELKNLKKIAVLKAVCTGLCSMTPYFVSYCKIY